MIERTIDIKNHNLETERALFLKMAHERQENYISAARLIMHLRKSKEWNDENFSFRSLSHVLDLMAHEINLLGSFLNDELLQVPEEEVTDQVAFSGSAAC